MRLCNYNLLQCAIGSIRSDYGGRKASKTSLFSNAGKTALRAVSVLKPIQSYCELSNKKGNQLIDTI